MFDIGFSEIVVIAVVALVVIGPERLPKIARTLGHLFGRLQRYVNDVKADINREMELDELRKLQQQVKIAATDIQQSVDQRAAQRRRGGRAQRRARAQRRRRDDRRGDCAASSRRAAGRRRRRDASAGSAETARQPRCPASTRSDPTASPAGRAARTRALPPPMNDHPRQEHAGNVHLAPDRAAHAAAARRSSRSSSCCSCLFPFAKEIYALLAQPLMHVLPQGATMIATDVTGTFLVPLKVTLMAAFLIALPYVLWQMWAFVAPGLYQHEKRLACR